MEKVGIEDKCCVIPLICGSKQVELIASESKRFVCLGLGIKIVGMLVKGHKIQLGMKNKFKRYSVVPKVKTVF